MNTEQPKFRMSALGCARFVVVSFCSLVFRMWTSQCRGVHNPSCPPQLSGARQARDVGGNPCITALAKERERRHSDDPYARQKEKTPQRGSAKQPRKARPTSTHIQENSLKVLFAFYGGTSTARAPGYMRSFPSAEHSSWTCVPYVRSTRSIWCEAKEKSAATCDWTWCCILSGLF